MQVTGTNRAPLAQANKRVCPLFVWLNLLVISRIAPFAVAIAASSSTGARDAVTSEPADPEHPEYEELHQLLWFSRSGKRGRAQKIQFIREGVQLQYLSPTYPHLTTSAHSPLETFNFLARSKVQVNTEAQQRLEEEHRRRQELRGHSIEVLLPDSVSLYMSTDGGDFLLQGHKAVSS